MDRNLDGVYFRVQRNGKWESVCFSDLTEDQMYEAMSGKNEDWVKSLAVMLGTTIRNIGDQLDLMLE